MSFTNEQLAQLKELIVQALKEVLGSGVVTSPPAEDKVILRKDGAVQSTKLLDYKGSYEKSADPKKVAFAKYIPEWFFVEEALNRTGLTDAQKFNIQRNTNEARMRGGFLADRLYVGPASTYTKLFFGFTYPDEHIPDAASLPGNNGPAVPAVTLADVPQLFENLYERFVTTQHVPSWKTVELLDP